ncbi:MAG: AraC family transcriptional regulator [Flavobacteriales bacterium]|uniref:helix-turn-helix transcriptional regulator n=1 Tax=Candidatus Ulvibacter alkanivorans TaxID=2267620 RepID=UPI000DF18ADE|nr:AraC family transcriptional regulator [Candidatus Ulvibacter alkanivorans]MCH2489106.1 AraC family transcriptional regulator [Flavobacteriales bacterium]
MECETIRYTRPHYFPEHLHPNLYTFSYILGGTALLQFKNGEIRLHPDQLVVIPPFMAHQTVVEHSFYYKVIRVPRSYALIHKRSDAFLHIQQGNPLVKKAFISWFDAIREHSTKTNEAPVIPKIFKNYIQQDQTAIGDTSDKLIRSLEFLNSNYSRTIHLEELSDVVHMSSSHFNRQFLSHVGISPIRYLLNLRIEKAKELIKEEIVASFTDVAYETGFYDQSHFNKYFKTHVGMIPKQYAELVHND